MSVLDAGMRRHSLFGQYRGIYCSSAAGRVIEQDKGSSYCTALRKAPEQGKISPASVAIRD